MQPHKMSRGLKFRMWRDYILYIFSSIEKHWFQGVVGLYFLCSKNIGADQLRSLILQNCKRQFCQDAVLSYTRFVLISSFDYAKGVNITLWLG